MKFEKGTPKKYRKSVEDAFQTIIEKGDENHRAVMNEILESKMLVRVKPVREINASGITGLIDAASTNAKLGSERMDRREAFGEVYIAIANETIDTGGQRGCEGTFVHEGRHAFDFAQTISSISNADVNPLSLFNPTLYELEWEAHKTAGNYMIQMNLPDYLSEGLSLMILGQNPDGTCFVNDDVIRQRLRESYGLALDGNQGAVATDMLGLKHL
jgi:hypothetical protein